jgi:hypothetical protein
MTNREGFVLPTVVFAVAVMSIVAVAAINTASDERRTSRATREATVALYAAESGLRKTYGNWPVAPVKALNPGDSLNLGWEPLPNGASFRAVIHRLDKGGLQEYNVVVQGRRTGRNGGVATIVGVVGGVPVLTYGVFSKTNISLGGGGSMDSYDSEVAAYNALKPDSNATVWSNGNLDINRTTVLGPVSAAGAITSANWATVNATGGIHPNEAPAPEMDINACPTTGFTPAAQVPSGPGISYNSGTGVLTVTSGAILNLTGTSYYFSRVILAGNSQLLVTPPAGARVEIAVSDSLDLRGGTVVNQTLAPTSLGFSSCGSPVPAKTFLVSGGAAAAFSVYAPNHPVVLTGNSDLFGAVVASSFTATGGAKLHYDEALSRIASKKLMVQKGTWSMLPGS